ncbi:hypothetical protein EDC01DRAFT_174710 [Geopyxis carbonaria]|nr:hypothetical protein EDC01DRAFT_174710 [Geopyxis carbonaria]
MATNSNGTGDEQKCRKCKENIGKYVIRLELQCRDCFDKFIRSKCVKRMESYKIRPYGTEIPTFLLPVSFGVSSTTLLHLLDLQLRHQRERVTRTRYKLKIIHIDETILDSSLPSGSHLEKLKERFPDAGEYMVAKLEDIYDFSEGSEVVEPKNGDISNFDAMQQLILALKSPTSRMDMAGVIKTRLMVAIAKRENCEGILWGDSTTKLSEKTLAETAKGRGFSLPWQISDGPSPYGLKFLYPLRDILKKELVTYTSEIVEPPLMPLCIAYSSKPKHSVETATSGRNITVDELMVQYFESMEEQYPSIVSNVTRTADRLTAVDPDATVCKLCGLPGDGSGGLILGVDESSTGMCYGCMRSTHDAASYSWPV